MRIATLGPTHPVRGGIARFTTQLVRSLRQRHQVEFFAFRRQYPRLFFPGSTQPDPSRSTLREEPVGSVDGLNPLSWISTARRVVALEPDLLLLQWWTSYWLGLYTVVARRARAAHIPILTFAHQFVEPDSSFLEWFVTRRALRHTDGLVVMSEEDVGMARRVLPGKTVRLGPMPALHVPEGDRIPRAEARARLGVDPTASLLLFFGFVRRYKGLNHLLEALSRVPDVQLLVAGEFWENEDTYRAQVCRLDLGDRAMLVNRYIHNEEVELYFGAADALVLPYVSASQSAVGATALAFGLPLIATRVGGLQELVVDGATGLMVAPGSSEQLADAIARFFRDRLGERFREAIAGEHRALGWETLVRTIEEAAAEITTSAPSAEGAP